MKNPKWFSFLLFLLLPLGLLSLFFPSSLPSVVQASTTQQVRKPGFLTIKDGYYWDRGLREHFFAKGIAYQTWIADLGEWQTDEQIDWDLREIAKMGSNSIRVDFVWKHIEVRDNVFQWDRYDRLVDSAEKYGLKIFALIGYQWPPTWFPGQENVLKEGNDINPGWMTMHPPGPSPAPPFVKPTYNYTEKWVSDIMSFEHPAGRKQFQDFLAAVAARYRNRTSIGGWIIGNEFGYIGLWSYRQDGYDASCQAAYRRYLSEYYKGDLASANRIWRTNYRSWNQVPMPPAYDRNDPLWGDLVQWRIRSVANLMAVGARAVRRADPNHMISYSTVGMIWGPEDWRYHAENVGFIARACERVGARLAFMSINNYPNGMAGDELRTGKWGFRFSKWMMNMPVMLSETGFTATEDLFPVFATQSQLLRNTLWEAVIGGGSVGIHVFTWPYRQWKTTREQGFGIITADRIFSDAITEIGLLYNIIEQKNFARRWLPGSEDATPDVAFFWTNSTDQMYNRYQANMQAIWGPLERLGFEPRFMNKEQLLAGEFRQVKVLILPRNQRLDPGDLLFIQSNVLPAGVHVYADADLPGMEDYQIRPNRDFNQRMMDIFGIRVIRPNVFQDTVIEYEYGIERTRVDSRTLQSFGAIPRGTSDTWWTWKYHDIEIVNATKVSTVRWSRENWSTEHDGLAIKDHGRAKAAISSFAMGDLSPSGVAPWELPDKLPWALHYKWFHALFRSKAGFGLASSIPSVGSPYVMVDERKGGTATDRNGNRTTWATVTNWSDDTTESVRFFIPAFRGKTVIDVYKNRALEVNSDGILNVTLRHNEMVVLQGSPGGEQPSLLITKYPTEMKPRATTYPVTISFNAASFGSGTNTITLQVIRTGISGPLRVVATSRRSIRGRYGEAIIPVYIPSPTQAMQAWYRSQDENGTYIIRASLTNRAGRLLTTTELPVYISWGLRPVWPLLSGSQLRPGTQVNTQLRWEWLDPLARINAFPGRVLVYYSSKTQQVDWAHGEKTGMVTTWLESMGYRRAYLGPLSEELKREGPLYFMLSDDMNCEWGLCGTNGVSDKSLDGTLYNLNAYYLIRSFKTIILPGVHVMNDIEVNNLRTWFHNVTDAKLISTEGGVGRLRPDGSSGEGRLRGLFGMAGNAQSIQNNFNVTLNINSQIDHYINRAYTGRYGSPRLPNQVRLVSRIGSSFFWPAVAKSSRVTVLGSFTVQGQPTRRPALVVHRHDHRKSTFLFNFDPTIYHQLNDSKTLRPLTTALHDWMVLGRYINKMDWELRCTTGRLVAVQRRFILKGSGITSVRTTIPRTLPCPTSQLFWRGLVYPWESTNPFGSRIGFFSSRDRPRTVVVRPPSLTARSVEEDSPAFQEDEPSSFNEQKEVTIQNWGDFLNEEEDLNYEQDEEEEPAVHHYECEEDACEPESRQEESWEDLTEGESWEDLTEGDSEFEEYEGEADTSSEFQEQDLLHNQEEDGGEEIVEDLLGF